MPSATDVILDASGGAVRSIGLALTARDFARWGLMLCNGGQVGSGKTITGIKDFINDVQQPRACRGGVKKQTPWHRHPPILGTGVGRRRRSRGESRFPTPVALSIKYATLGSVTQLGAREVLVLLGFAGDRAR